MSETSIDELKREPERLRQVERRYNWAIQYSGDFVMLAVACGYDEQEVSAEIDKELSGDHVSDCQTCNGERMIDRSDSSPSEWLIPCPDCQQKEGANNVR